MAGSKRVGLTYKDKQQERNELELPEARNES